MATQSLAIFSTANLSQSGGSLAWSFTTSGGYAAVAVGTGQATPYVMATVRSQNHGFSIPAGAIIDGIKVTVDARNPTSGSSFGSAVTFQAQINLPSATAKNVNFPVGTASYVAYVLGSSADLWGRSWTASDINASTFGMTLAQLNSQNNSDATIRRFEIEVSYTPYTTVEQDQLGDAMVRATTDKDQLGDAQIRATTMQDQLGDARIQIITSRDQLGDAQITKFVGQDQLGDASIYNSVDRIQLGSAAIVYGADRDQIGDALIVLGTPYGIRPRIGFQDIQPAVRQPIQRPQMEVISLSFGDIEDPNSPLVDDLYALVDDPYALVGHFVHNDGTRTPVVSNGAKIRTNVNNDKPKGNSWPTSPRVYRLSRTSIPTRLSPMKTMGPGTIRSTPNWPPSSPRSESIRPPIRPR
jgi:hypothetical protein